MSTVEPLKIQETHLASPTVQDLIEEYYKRGWTDGLPVVPPTREKIDTFVAALGGGCRLCRM